MRLNRILAAGAATAALLLTACGTTADVATSTDAPDTGNGNSNGQAAEVDPSDVVIGIAMTSMDPWLQLLADGTEAEANELGVEARLVSAEADAVTQLTQVENFITQGVTALVVNPVDTEAADPMTQAALNAGVPLVYVNRCPAGLPETVPCVNSDSVEAGRLLMGALAELNDNEGTVAILEGDPTNNGEAVRDRTTGCQAIIDENPGMELAKSGNGKWTREAAMMVTENWIQAGDMPDMICANNDEMALGAINALRAAGMLDQVKVGGIDATDDALDSMRDGELSVSVFQDPVAQGTAAVQTAMKLVQGEAVENHVDVPFELVTLENVDTFKDE